MSQFCLDSLVFSILEHPHSLQNHQLGLETVFVFHCRSFCSCSTVSLKQSKKIYIGYIPNDKQKTILNGNSIQKRWVILKYISALDTSPSVNNVTWKHAAWQRSLRKHVYFTCWFSSLNESNSILPNDLFSFGGGVSI